MRKKFYVSLVMLLLVALAFAGCSAKEEAVAPTTGGEQQK